MTPGDHADVLVITALKLERRAVCAHLSDVAVETTSGLAAGLGRFQTNGRSVSVAVIETGAGNVDAAVLTARAEESFRPKIIAMTGVAGALKDLGIGDVVASSKVYWLEAGKQNPDFSPRPDQAPVSSSLVQLARAVAADGRWMARVTGGGSWPDNDREPEAVAAPIVAGEKVVADRRAEVAELARRLCSDALAVDMEDFGTLRGGRSTERARVISIRGISDLVDGKAAADAQGSQPLAAANAAAFLFELVALDASAAPPAIAPDALAAIGVELYPEGPQQHSLWRRAGGDESRLQPSGPGFARWWHAAVLLDQGGGGAAITTTVLVQTMSQDFPHNDALASLRDQP